MISGVVDTISLHGCLKVTESHVISGKIAVITLCCFVILKHLTLKFDSFGLENFPFLICYNRIETAQNSSCNMLPYYLQRF